MTDSATQTRLEALIEQQNLLLLRQLQLAESAGRKNSTVEGYHYKNAREVLQTLDPRVRRIFAEWRNDFCAKLKVYITQSRLSKEYHAATTNGELMKPLLEEVRKPWEWTQFYRSIAKPFEGVDTSLQADGVVDEADGASQLGEHSNAYNIDTAFSELRHRHAWEVQNFVSAHQKVCLQKLMEELELPQQVLALHDKLSVWIAEHAGMYNAEQKYHLERQAQRFVELVHNDEKPKAESKISQDNAPSSMHIVTIRIVCILAVVYALATMTHEVLTQLFSVLFALGCGIALLWEDLLMYSLRLLMGETARRLRALGSRADGVMTMPSFISISVPTIFW